MSPEQSQSTGTPEPPGSDETISPRRRQILESALIVLSDEGLRGLTHRAVDRQAGLPEGSTSAYLRTRKALQCALGEYVAAQLTTDVAALTRRLAQHPDDPDLAPREIGRMFHRWLSDRRLLVARLELSIESARDPDLRAVFESWRPHLGEIVELGLQRRDAHLSTPSPISPATRAEVLMASLDGVLFCALQRPESERRAYVDECLPLMIGPLGGGTQ